MLAKIGFENLHIRCLLGVHPHERAQEQDIFIDLYVEMDIEKGVQSDNLQDVVSYEEIALLCHEIAQTNKHYLIETLAGTIAKHVLAEFPVEKVSIKVKKPAALPSAQHAYVELEL